MILRKYLCAALFCVFSLTLFSADNNAQSRERIARNPQNGTQQGTQPQVIKPTSSRPTTPPPVIKRPPLTTDIVIVSSNQTQPSLVKKTGSSNPTSTTTTTTKTNLLYSAASTSMMINSIKAKLGIPYLYGSTGPNRYDCSGFVWSVFNESGFSFERSSAATYWNTFEPVTGDDRYKFGTLVFFNRLGHMGIVADENGFYHASSSKGITYSKFEGYWGKRIVGYRRIPLAYLRSLSIEAKQ